ncbi:MAG: helix-turn-helix domain-containing protein, partial [Clostridiales bacterium]|nr:helix-turn-helix domain-containing protein [Clostridiales bacterium]
MARELVNAKGTVPLRLVEMNPPDIGKSWREELCLFFVLWGEAEVIVCESRSLLKADDIIAINPNTVFEARSQECSALMLYIGVSALLDDKDCPMAFDCDSSKADDKARFFALKNLIATFLKENAGGAKNNAYFNGAIAYSLLLELQNSFLDVGKTASALKSAEQVQGVVREINERYREGITLKELAQSQNFSVSYFSIFFKRHFGVGFAEYYNSFRLERAVSELLSSEQPIETIARNHGFGDVRSFVSLFKKRYGMLPSAYRKEKASLTDSWRESEFESGIYGLSKYLTRPQKQTYLSMPESIEEKTLSAGKISILHGTPLKHTFRVFTSVGRAKELLYADVQNMLAGLQKEIGYQYIKFHGILSDDMLLYSESRGVPTYSFVMLDKALDFLMSIGLRPLVQFSFMPRKLATDLNLNVYFSPFNVSMPNDMGKWERLIKTVTEHFVQRYGICEVRQWLFCLWNEPNVNIFTPQGDEIIFELYRITRAAVKSVSKSLLFGMPSLVHVLTEAAWANRYFEMCRNFGCMPDFCNIHYYDNDISQGDIIPTYESLKEQDAWLKKTFKQNNDENAFRNAIPAFKALFEKNGAGSLPIYMTEWNMTISHRNLLNDTCFKACYLAKNILENYDALDS